ncbi:MAG TPA: polyprenyl synthetase family protein [Streptosporangiaceae bacterium]|nr:polyprenyl synthetase family protein [Streptosporangiaceae bacterium]
MTAGVGTDRPVDLAFIAGRLRPYLAGLLTAEQAAWKERGAPWWDVPEALAVYTDGGKALRPRFCYWGHALSGKRAGAALLRACAALELLHAFALIHDDLMDGSGTRRGGPALHRRFAEEHRRHRWASDADAYGCATALLSGDFAFALANRLAGALPRRARDVWADIVEDLTIGQFLDLAGAARRDRSPGVARTTALLKSGRYTVTGPLRLGAAVAGSTELPPDLVRYGDLVGEAFQFRDDLLGVFGDPRRTGKPVGEDLRAGKPTLLIASAAVLLPPAKRPLLSRIGSSEVTGADIAELTDALDTCGVRDRVEFRITRNVRAACALARGSAAPSPVREALCAMASVAVGGRASDGGERRG